MSTESAVAVRPSEVTEEQLFPEGTSRLMLVMPLQDGRARALVLDELGEGSRVIEGELADVLALTPRRSKSWCVGVFVNRQLTITSSVAPGPGKPSLGGGPPEWAHTSSVGGGIVKPSPGGEPPGHVKQVLQEAMKVLRDVQYLRAQIPELAVQAEQ